ncbi:Patatin [Fulvivirga imtechensis AK7]|uniref:Patatin n=1 Tax=Fulvivirga imtechensis AK7 TaxID=1237149 RepID=L8JYI2_9BACT|nr:patatin-like phospholipase family protein [Fulvivirga imtechensis]ELR73840.1 Patatin [Fulvivirga imtechensis AK7]
MKKVGLVLSGGGARGIAHLGVIKALEEAGLIFSAISGSSAGAIIGAFYAQGFTADEIICIVKEVKTYHFLLPSLSWKGLLKIDVIRRFADRHLRVTTFEELAIPLYVAATHLKSGRTKIFQSGDLVSALAASSCIPVLFDPVEYEGELYIDGGILNNLPVEPVRKSCDVVIGSHCNPVDHNFDAKNAKLVMERALLLAISCNVYSRSGLCDFFFEPKGLETYKVMDLSAVDDMYEIGYIEAKKQIEAQQIVERLNT